MKFFKWILPVIVLLTGGSLYLTNNDHSEASHLTSRQLSQFDRGNLVKQFPEREPLPDLGIQAKAVILFDVKTGQILYENNMELPLPAASMSKIMTELLVLEAINNGQLSWDQKIPLSDYVMTISSQPGLASVALNKNQTYSVRELFDAMAIHSANDAAIALSEAVAGSEKNFVIMMNEKAKQLGLEQAYFVNSSGLNNRDLGEFYSTGGQNDSNTLSAKDLALLAKQLILEHPEILQIVDKPILTFDGETYTNTNSMLQGRNDQQLSFAGVDGLKTGYTEEAGYCFVGTVKRQNTRFISVVMGTSTLVDRFSETKRLYEAAFSTLDM